MSSTLLGGTFLYPAEANHELKVSSCRCSCALRMMGSEAAPQSLSATTIAARSTCSSVGSSPVSSHGNRSRSASSPMVSEIRCNCSICSDFAIRGGIRGGVSGLPSIEETRFLLRCASPTSRSLARGGAQTMRNMGSTPGLAIRVFGETLRSNSVISRAFATCPVVCARCVLKVSGAKRRNQSL